MTVINHSLRVTNSSQDAIKETKMTQQSVRTADGSSHTLQPSSETE